MKNSGGEGPGRYAAPQLEVNMREADSYLLVTWRIAYPNSEGSPLTVRAGGIDQALAVIREAWALSAPGRDAESYAAAGESAG